MSVTSCMEMRVPEAAEVRAIGEAAASLLEAEVTWRRPMGEAKASTYPADATSMTAAAILPVVNILLWNLHWKGSYEERVVGTATSCQCLKQLSESFRLRGFETNGLMLRRALPNASRILASVSPRCNPGFFFKAS